MKIAVISTTIWPLGNMGLSGYGGLEQIAWHCAKGLASLGHDVTLLAPDGSVCPGAKVHGIGPAGRISDKMAYGEWNGSGYWKMLPEFDAIIDHSWGRWSNMLKAEGKLSAPILNVMHAPIPGMLSQLPPNNPKPCFVCISQDQANHFEALFSHPARVCHNGVDTDFYRPIMGIERTDRFLFLARFSTIKGPLLAIEACRKVGVGLDLVGDKNFTQEPAYFAQCESQCDGRQIVMHGNATRGETVWWYSRAYCMIHPNRDFREPFGLAPVESMLCGSPVIAWDNGAMRETVDQGTSGWLCRSLDELAALIEKAASHPVSREIREDCRAWATKFSLENMAKRYSDLCEEAVSTGGW